MTHASLFSGIGGFDLAAEWAGWTNTFNCEIDPFCQNILKCHFPNAIQYGDIKTTDFTLWRGRIDVLTGGFPCQPFSLAGKRRGTEDDRYLWPEMPGLFGLFDPAGSWARTFSELLICHKEWSSNRCALTWKRRDTRYNRSLYQLAVSALPTSDTEHGLLPTPAASEGEKYTTKYNPDSQMGKGLTALAMNGMLPTPAARDWKGRTNPGTVKAGCGNKYGDTLPDAILKLLPTPKASDHQSPGNHGTGGQDLRTVVSSRTGGTSQLNPLFVAEMMGFPADWTVLPFQAGESNLSKGSEMPSCRK